MPGVSRAWRTRSAVVASRALWAVLSLVVAGPYAAARPSSAEKLDEATSSWTARRESIQAMPLGELSDDDLETVRFVLGHTTTYRRMPTKTIHCDPHLFLFLLRHPEVVVDIWSVLGISKVSLRRTDDQTYTAGDGQGTMGFIKVLHDEPNRQLIYAEGTYEGPLLKWPVQGKCVLLLRTRYDRRRDGHGTVTARLDSFTYLDRAAVELLAKTFQPLIGLAADYNFTETMAFVGNLSQATEYDAQRVARLYDRLPNVDQQTREQLVELSLNMAARTGTERPPRPLKLAGRMDWEPPPEPPPRWGLLGRGPQ